MKIIDAETGSSSLTIGNSSMPIPTGGYSFTCNVTLENMTNLYTYEVAIMYNKSFVNCTGAAVDKNDADYVFYQIPSGSMVAPTYFNRDPTYVAFGATALTATVNVLEPRLLCQLYFTASRIGTTSLEFILGPLSLYDQSSLLLERTQSGFGEPVPVPFLAENFTVTVEGVAFPPIASFTFEPDRPEPLQNVTFDASTSYPDDGTIVSYTWDFGDGANETSASPIVTHSFSGGVYIVKLTVFDDQGLFGSSEKLVAVGVLLPVPSFTWSVVSPAHDLSVSFDGSRSRVGEGSPGSIVAWEWNFGDGSPSSTYPNPFASHDYAASGTYIVKLTVYDSDGLYNSTSQFITTQYIFEYPVFAFVLVLSTLASSILLVVKGRRPKIH